MMDFYNWLKRKFCSADCRVKFSHHFIISFFSEISKFIIMGIFFYVTGRLPYYLWGICLLSVLRFYGGGPHCKTYMGSLLSSFAYMLVCVQILSSFSVSRLFQLILLSAAIITAYRIAPIPSVYRPIPAEERPRQCKLQLYIVIFLYDVLVFICPQNLFMLTGFWVIMVHTVHLAATYLKKEYGQAC